MAQTNMHFMYIKVRRSLNNMIINKVITAITAKSQTHNKSKIWSIFSLRLYSLWPGMERELVSYIQMSDNDDDNLPWLALLLAITCWARTWLRARICSRCFFSSFMLMLLSLSFPASKNQLKLRCWAFWRLLFTIGVAEESANIFLMESAFFSRVLFSSGDDSSLCDNKWW